VRSSLVAIAIVVGAAFLPACHHGVVVSSDPSAPIYRSPTADLSQVQSLKVHFTSVTTSNNEGADLVKSAFLDSIKSHLGSHFKTLGEGDSAATGEAILDVDLTVNWGNRGARIFAGGYGAGRAGIVIKYSMKDSAGTLLAKMETKDTMASGADSKALVFSAAEKWNKYFSTTVLAAPAPH